ncbi:MAG: hypothetical protein AAF828_12950, partial [Bacteroidota bacterium]
NYISIFDRLDIDAKLALLSAMTDNIKNSIKKKKTNKTDTLYSLYGSWSDVEDNIIEEIYKHRSIPSDDISFD